MTPEYLEFVEIIEELDFVAEKATGKTKRIAVKSKKHGFKLGEIRWYGAWRQYAFFPEPETLFDRLCMGAIMAFMQGLMDARRSGLS